MAPAQMPSARPSWSRKGDVVAESRVTTGCGDHIALREFQPSSQAPAAPVPRKVKGHPRSWSAQPPWLSPSVPTASQSPRDALHSSQGPPRPSCQLTGRKPQSHPERGLLPVLLRVPAEPSCGSCQGNCQRPGFEPCQAQPPLSPLVFCQLKLGLEEPSAHSALTPQQHSDRAALGTICPHIGGD